MAVCHCGDMRHSINRTTLTAIATVSTGSTVLIVTAYTVPASALLPIPSRRGALLLHHPAVENLNTEKAVVQQFRLKALLRKPLCSAMVGNREHLAIVPLLVITNERTSCQRT